jgi:hypothetical protein
MRRRVAPALLVLALVLAVGGCGADDVRTSISNAVTDATVPTLPSAPTVTTTTPAQTVVQTTAAPAAPARTTTATSTRTTVTTTGGGAKREDSALPIVLVLIAAALIVLAFVALWRRARSEPSGWDARLASAQGATRWAATDLPPALLDPGRTSAERDRAWRAQRPEVDRTIRELTALAQEARRGADRDAVGATAVALSALVDALDAHVASGTSDAAALVQLRARDVLAALERRTR